MLDDFQGAGLATLREISVALQRFKAAGKPVVAWGSRYDQRQYSRGQRRQRSAAAPDGLVHLQGYGRYRNYYRDALDRLGVTVNLIRVGTYKSFGEPFVANAPSPASIEAESQLNDGCGRATPRPSRQARKLPAGSMTSASTNCRSAWPRPAATWPSWRWRPSWSTA